MPTITVKVPRALAERLRRAVARRRSTRSAVVRGAIEALLVGFDLRSEATAVGGLLRRYRSLPMDLADACLVRMSELRPDSVVLTVGSEFRDVYRRNGRLVIPTLLPPGARRRG